MGDLGGPPQGQLLGRRVVLCEQTASLQRDSRVPLDAEFLPDHEVRLVEGFVHGSPLDLEVARDVGACMRLEQRRARRHRIVRVEDDVDRLVIDLEQLGRVLRQVANAPPHPPAGAGGNGSSPRL